MAAASWAHIAAYRASVAKIAGVFWPKKFVATRAASSARLAAITGGGTVIVNAASYAATAARAWLAVASALAPVEVHQSMYGVTADTIAVDVGPTHELLVNSANADP